MKHVFLGDTGLAVSRLCLGAMTFGREADEATSHAMLDVYADAGGNFVDTANVYSQGVSEEILGRWLARKRREDFVIATKARYPMGEGPNDRGLGRKHLVDALDASLRRLGTDYVDLYQVHAWDPATPLAETLSTLSGFVAAGKVRHLGASNFSGWQLQKAIDLSKQMNWEPFRCLQPLYNLLDRSAEWELLPVCGNEGLGVIPWSPLRGGWLSGKIRRGMTGPERGSRVETAERLGWTESWSSYGNDSRTWAVLDTLSAVATEIERPVPQVAIAWLLHQPNVSSPIIGARDVDQLRANLGAATVSLGSEQLAALTKASEQPLPYPYWITNVGPQDR
jgi:aryl-alcohol dehydrogenase-like predicted oxidoreductase